MRAMERVSFGVANPSVGLLINTPVFDAHRQ